MPPRTIRDLDFKPRPTKTSRWSRLRRLSCVAAGVVGLTAGVLLLTTQNDAAADIETGGSLLKVRLALPPLGGTITDADEEQTAQADPEAGAELETQQHWELVEVKRGDTLAGIFNSIGLSAKTMYQVLAAGEATKTLKRIFPGEQMHFLIQDGELLAMRYPVDESVTLHNAVFFSIKLF